MIREAKSLSGQTIPPEPAATIRGNGGSNFEYTKNSKS